MKGKPGRHAPAFVLLELALAPNYGLGILNKLKDQMPHCFFDTAAVYRALSALEDDGLITSSIPEPSNQNRKLYEITEFGLEALKEYRKNIAIRHEILTYFLKTYDEVEVKHE